VRSRTMAGVTYSWVARAWLAWSLIAVIAITQPLVARAQSLLSGDEQNAHRWQERGPEPLTAQVLNSESDDAPTGVVARISRPPSLNLRLLLRYFLEVIRAW
jgi:hypothetical protein